MTKTAIKETNIKGLKLAQRGKVRDIYDLNIFWLIIATDRMSAFDVVLPDPIPGKGIILNRITNFWFRQFLDIIPHHLVSDEAGLFSSICPDYKEILDDNVDLLSGRAVIVEKLDPLPIECIVRGYISGSGLKSYRKDGIVCGITLPTGLKESEILPEPIFTPSTKEEGGKHDVNISFEKAKELIGDDLANQVKYLSLKIYKRGSELALEQGIIIADTKFEFGLNKKGELILIDEVLTPDSSRFWPEADYEAGRAQKSFDKQYLRDYLVSIGWDQKPPGPKLPIDIISTTAEKYQEALDRIISIGN